MHINYKRINRFLGITLGKEEILEILTRLGLSVDEKGQSLLVYPPSFRNDLKRESDIAEEIARIYGYEMIPKKISKSPLPSGVINKKLLYRKMIYESMRQSGFTEAINYSFMNPSSLDTFLIPGSDRRQNTISIQNPLRQEESRLRTTLIPSLVENCRYNLDRGIHDIRLFEIASVFEDTGKQLPIEEMRLGGILYKEDSPSLWKDNVEGFFIVKGTIESLLEEVKISQYKFLPSSEPFLHKGKSADIYISDMRIGYLGVVAPQVLEAFDFKKKKPELVLFELTLDYIFSNIPQTLEYHSIPKYPFINRDIALVLDDTIASSTVTEIIRSFPSKLIENVSIFDVYKGDNVPIGKKSLAFNIIYRDRDKTLTDQEVEEVHTALVHFIIEKTGGTLRT
jgi:phenylalanyl-tRNA synthetase beta chain